MLDRKVHAFIEQQMRLVLVRILYSLYTKYNYAQDIICSHGAVLFGAPIIRAV